MIYALLGPSRYRSLDALLIDFLSSSRAHSTDVRQSLTCKSVHFHERQGVPRIHAPLTGENAVIRPEQRGEPDEHVKEF